MQALQCPLLIVTARRNSFDFSWLQPTWVRNSAGRRLQFSAKMGRLLSKSENLNAGHSRSRTEDLEMFVPLTFSMALVMMITSTICWGSWANTYKLTRGYRFELFYWDYAVGVLVASFFFALTLGSHPAGASSFLANLHSASASNMLYAALGGFIFNVANVLLLAGIEIAGLAIAFPLSIGIALVEGVVLSYIVQPKGQLTLLGGGVVMALAAVLLIGRAYASMSRPGQTVSKKGTTICVVSGLLMGAF